MNRPFAVRLYLKWVCVKNLYIHLSFSISISKCSHYRTPFAAALCWQNRPLLTQSWWKATGLSGWINSRLQPELELWLHRCCIAGLIYLLQNSRPYKNILKRRRLYKSNAAQIFCHSQDERKQLQYFVAPHVGLVTPYIHPQRVYNLMQHHNIYFHPELRCFMDESLCWWWESQTKFPSAHFKDVQNQKAFSIFPSKLTMNTLYKVMFSRNSIASQGESELKVKQMPMCVY